MATINSIGTSGRDYSTLQSWEDAVPATPTNGYEGHCYNDGELTGQLVIDGHTTSGTDYIKLTTASGQSFMDHADAATNAQYYDQTKGVGLNSTGDDSAIRVADDYVTVEKLQIRKTGGYYSSPCIISTNGGGTNSVVRNILGGRSISSSNGNNAALLNHYAGQVYNCLFYQTASSGGSEAGLYMSASSAGVRNCTFINLAAAGSTIAVSTAFSGSSSVINCVFIGWATAESHFSSTPTLSNLATDLASGFSGSGHVYSIVAADQWENASTDFRVKAGSDLIGAGADTSAYTSGLDIIGQDRDPDTPNIGHWEYQALAAPNNSIIMNTNELGTRFTLGMGRQG